VETPVYISELRVVGGRVAVDFVNTQDGPADAAPTFECLQSYGDFVAWAHHVGLLRRKESGPLLRNAREHPRRARAMHNRALETRDSLYEVLHATARGARARAVHLERVREAERDALSHGRLEASSEGGFTWRWADRDDLGRILWPVIHDAATLLTSPELERLKACAACRWLFVDNSRNKQRRWCTMEVCGTHEKMRRYIARRAAGRTSPAVP
jgi:predicted RNA-binding Zn ribbon-like protein